MVRTFTVMTVLVAGIGFAAAAGAADAKMNDCVHMAKQVSVALETAQPSEATDQAKDLARNARAYCSISKFDNGVALYSKALTLLGKS